jgi:drug/metabolite transporter (DMT)-like permease
MSRGSTPSARAGLAALGAAAVGFGSLAVTTTTAETAFGPMTLLVVELAAAAAVLLTATALLGLRLPRPSPAVLALGALEPGGAYVAFNLGVQRTSSSHASLVLGLETVFVVVLGVVVLRDRPSARVLGGTAVAVAGVMLLALGPSSPSSGASLTGDLLVLVTTLAAAGYVVLASRLAATVHPVALTAAQFVVGLAVAAPVSAWALVSGTEHWPTHPGAGPVVAAIATGVFGSASAFLLYTWALTRVSPSAAGASLTLTPLAGLVLSAAVLGEAVTMRAATAAALIVLGLLACVVRPSRPGRVWRATGRGRASV